MVVIVRVKKRLFVDVAKNQLGVGYHHLPKCNGIWDDS
jgi:hypothetical protein